MAGGIALIWVGWEKVGNELRAPPPCCDLLMGGRGGGGVEDNPRTGQRRVGPGDGGGGGGLLGQGDYGAGCVRSKTNRDMEHA